MRRRYTAEQRTELLDYVTVDGVKLAAAAARIAVTYSTAARWVYRTLTFASGCYRVEPGGRFPVDRGERVAPPRLLAETRNGGIVEYPSVLVVLGHRSVPGPKRSSRSSDAGTSIPSTTRRRWTCTTAPPRAPGRTGSFMGPSPGRTPCPPLRTQALPPRPASRCARILRPDTGGGHIPDEGERASVPGASDSYMVCGSTSRRTARPTCWPAPLAPHVLPGTPHASGPRAIISRGITAAPAGRARQR
jgi:hypothetical protein